ncbi:MAG: glycosyltransferase family 39 protein, partial [Patescibacteria group bacterium]
MKRKIWLILAFALFLRLWGVEYGFPNFLISDERALVFGALKMIELKTLVPAFYPEEFRPLYYMPFMSYVFLIWLLPFLAIKYALAGFPALAEFKTSLILDPSSIWIWSRALVAILGALNVYIVYLMSKKIFSNERAAIFSAAFLAVSFFHVELSHMTRHWLPAVTLTYLAWLLILHIRDSDRLKNYICGGLVAGAAFVTNPSSVAVFVSLALMQWSRRQLLNKNNFILVGIFLLFGAAFILLHPFGITFAEPTKGGLDPAGSVLWRLRNIFGMGFVGIVTNLQLYFETLVKYEILLFVLAILGFGLSYKYRIYRVETCAALIFVASYVLVIFFMLISFSRPVVMLLPIFAVWAGFAFNWLFEKFLRTPTLKWLAVILVFGSSFAFSAQYDYLMGKKDTRVIATEWINENIPADSKVLAYLPHM